MWRQARHTHRRDDQRAPPGHTRRGRADRPTDRGKLFTEGIGISLLNPKVFLLFLALLPQFTSQSAGWPAGAEIIVLGVLHVGNCAIMYFAVGHGARTILTARPHAAKIIGTLSGIVMIGLGIALVVENALIVAN